MLNYEDLAAPTPDNLRALREHFGLTQIRIAELAGLKGALRWSDYECGRRNMDVIRWELLLIKLGIHPDYGPRREIPLPARQEEIGAERAKVRGQRKLERLQAQVAQLTTQLGAA